MANAKKEEVKAVEKFRAYESFITKKAQAVVDFQKSKEFRAL